MAATQPDRRITTRERRTVYQTTRQLTMPPRPPYISRFALLGRASVDTAVVPDIIDDLVQTDHLWRWVEGDAAEHAPITPPTQAPRIWLTVNDDRWLLDWLRWVYRSALDQGTAEALAAALNAQRQRLQEADDDD